jgi:hypothetical protein
VIINTVRSCGALFYLRLGLMTGYGRRVKVERADPDPARGHPMNRERKKERVRKRVEEKVK